MMNFIFLSVATLLGLLSQTDLRLLDDIKTTIQPSQISITNFYNQFGGILMNDFYHYLFEETAMMKMTDACQFSAGQNIVEIGPGSGFLLEKVLHSLNITSSSDDA